jgi:hypothetical protein
VSPVFVADIADVIRSTLNVPNSVLTSAAFTSNGLTISWLMEGSTPNVLSYTVSSSRTAQQAAAAAKAGHDSKQQQDGHVSKGPAVPHIPAAWDADAVIVHLLTRGSA